LRATQGTSKEGATALTVVGERLPHRRFDDLTTFWQCVFVTFFIPEALPLGSVCTQCGKRLSPTRKLKKASKVRLCAACRVKKWRRDYPQQARKMWREGKRRQRAH
jgi:hypothetical protein